MIKNITRYRESEDFVTCTFEILDLNPEEIDVELSKIKKTINEKWIEMLLVVKSKIKCELWIREDTVSKNKDILFAKKNLVIMLKKQGYNWGVETIIGDGYVN